MTAETHKPELSPLAQQLLALIPQEEVEEDIRMKAYVNQGFPPKTLLRAEERIRMCVEAPEPDDPNYY